MGRREEASRLWGEQEKSWSSVMQHDRLQLAVFRKGWRDRNNSMCTLRQNGYCDQRAKARKYTCLLPPDKIAALHVHKAKRRSFLVTGGAGERWSSGMKDAALPYTVWPSATKMGTRLTILSLSPLAAPTCGKAAVIRVARADSTLRTVWAVPDPNNHLGRRSKEIRCIRHGMPVSDQDGYNPVIPSLFVFGSTTLVRNAAPGHHLWCPLSGPQNFGFSRFPPCPWSCAPEQRGGEHFRPGN
jgi:hypothetical protein